MHLPVVAIVGRPNVGKSSLLGFLSRRLVSIVEPTAGVTRDRVSAVCEIAGRYYEFIDTGGYGIEDTDNLTKDVERQIQRAIDLADLILFLCDAPAGILPLDQEVARLLRRHSDRVLLVANKIDDPRQEPLAAEFSRLGFGEPIRISALHNHGRAELEEAITARLADAPHEAPADPVMKIAIVGQRNTGKSTFINALAHDERVIVSEVAGTTRDAVDVRFERDGRVFMAIDTAGVRRKAKAGDSIEYYGYTRVEASIRRADVVLLMIDSRVPITDVDKRLANLILEDFKPCVIVVNKWDLAKDVASTDDFQEYLAKTLPHMDFAPIVFTSANVGRNTDAAIDVAWSLFKQADERVSTGKLNAVLAEVMKLRGPSARTGVKIFYATQMGGRPPTIILFVNRAPALTESYLRFLVNRLRERLPFEEVPIRLVLRSRREQPAK